MTRGEKNGAVCRSPNLVASDENGCLINPASNRGANKLFLAARHFASRGHRFCRLRKLPGLFRKTVCINCSMCFSGNAADRTREFQFHCAAVPMNEEVMPDQCAKSVRAYASRANRTLPLGIAKGGALSRWSATGSRARLPQHSGRPYRFIGDRRKAWRSNDDRGSTRPLGRTSRPNT